MWSYQTTRSFISPLPSYVENKAGDKTLTVDALERLTAAIRDVESELAAMKAEHDPLAAHIFVSRRHDWNVKDRKGGKRRELNARLSFNTGCEPGFRGCLDDWERLMRAACTSSTIRTAWKAISSNLAEP
jgi:hypothetical protein